MANFRKINKIVKKFVKSFKNNLLGLKDKIKEITKSEPDYNYGLEYFDFHCNRYNDILEIFSEEENENGARLLDAGASPYHLSIILKELGFLVEAINIENDEYERIIKDNYGIKIKTTDLSSARLPYEDNAFDYILFSETMEHLNFNLENLFNEFYRILDKGGKIVISTPNLARLNNRIKMLIGLSINHDVVEAFHPNIHIREYTKKEMAYLLERAEFYSYKIYFKNFNYPNIRFIIKLINNVIGFFIPSTKSNIIVIAEKKI